jgi:hypothetical protein
MRDERDPRYRHDPDPAAGSYSEPGEPTIAPGRRTLTDRLSPRQADALSPAVQRKHLHGGANDDPQRAAADGTSGTRSSLPYLDQIQASFGRHDISAVAAYADDAAAAACEGLGAMAFASGDRVAFHGAPALHTAAHEAAHVVQQRAGVFLKDGLGDTGDIYEQHADAVADAVVRGESAEALLDAGPGGSATREHGTGDAGSVSSSTESRPSARPSPAGGRTSAVQRIPWMGPKLPPSGDALKRPLYLSLVSHPIAKLLLGHYIDASGETLSLTPEQMVDIKPIVDVRSADGFEALVVRMRQQAEETQQPVREAIPFMRGWGGACTSGTLGNFTIQYRGGVEVWPSGVWRFSGSIAFYDVFDFDARDDNSRPFLAEVKTRLGGAAIPGEPFSIVSPPMPATQTAFDRYLQWAGGFEPMAGPDISNRDSMQDGNMRPKLKREGTIGDLPLPGASTGDRDVSTDDSDD